MNRLAKSGKSRNAAIVLIPAYQPGDSLIEVVRELTKSTVSAIVVVDDGSGPAFRGTFDQVGCLPRVTILRHAHNQGKGAGLKTGMKDILRRYPHAPGVVTADADGQHHPEDILKVCHQLGESPQSLIMGVRGFEGHVPFRSKFGNGVTRRVMRV